MSEEEIAALHERVHAMADDERKNLDPIAYALGDFLQLHFVREGGYVLPNRVAALAAVDAVRAWEKTVWERE